MSIALAAAMERDSDVLLIGDSAGRWGASTALLASFGPDRVRALPISDRGSIGVAVGLALGGRKPVVQLTNTQRLLAVAEPLVECARVAAGGFAATLVVRVPYGEQAGPTLDTPIGSAVLPGVRIVCASSHTSAEALLNDALGRPGVTVLLEPRHGGVSSQSDAANGSACSVRDGHHLTIVTWGNGVQTALDVADSLAGEGISAQVLDLVTLAPLDATALGEALRTTGRLVVLHPNDLALSNHVVQTVVEGAFLYLEAPPARATTAREALAAAREAATW